MVNKKLSKTPISVCLLQLRFSSIESLEELFIPHIQEQFRRKGLQFFEKKTIQKLYSKSSSEFEIRDENVFVFYDANKTEMVQILTNEFNYHVYSYSGYDVLKNRYFELLDEFSKECDLSKVSVISIGLRYVNAIKGKNWRDYLNPEYFKIEIPSYFKKDINHEIVSAQDISETDLGNNDTGLLRVSITQNNNGKVIPSNIATIDLEEGQKGLMITLLDLDQIVRFKPDFEIDNMESYITKMHDITKSLFFDLISEKAIQEWEH